MNNTRQIKTFIGAMIAAAVITAGYAGLMSHALHTYFALAVLVLAAVTSRMKVKLPGINGNMSVNLPFLLTAVVSLSAAEAVVVTCVSTAVQCWPRKKCEIQSAADGVQPQHDGICQLPGQPDVPCRMAARNAPGVPARWDWLLATATLFLGQTAPVAAIVAVSEGKAAGQIWWSLAHLSFPYYVVSAGVTTMVQAVSSHMGWGLALAVFPIMYGIHRSYRVYFGRMVQALTPEAGVKAMGAGA